ncbi:MAG: carboxypeptidase regulatory-like domain-containing protein [Bryobacteraceae bacterium]
MALLLASRGLPAATVEGQVHLVGSRDSARKKTDYSGVVVWLTTPEEPAAHSIRKHAQMLQKDKKFLPHILAIETGTTVEFPNLDPIFHNAFSNYDGTIFDVALYPPGSSRQVRFDRPGIVRVFCNIHASMSAVIVVVNSNYFTTTGRQGHFSLPNVPPGEYEIHFFHERSTSETLDKLTRSIVVGDEVLDLGVTVISEAGYLPVAHKNKYDRDYPPNSDDIDGYSSPVK